MFTFGYGKPLHSERLNFPWEIKGNIRLTLAVWQAASPVLRQFLRIGIAQEWRGFVCYLLAINTCIFYQILGYLFGECSIGEGMSVGCGDGDSPDSRLAVPPALSESESESIPVPCNRITLRCLHLKG